MSSSSAFTGPADFQRRLSNDRLSNDQFNLTYSSSGLSSVKHTHDAYDTDYITAGRTLGDVVVRYRSAGDSAWQEVSSGNSAVAANQRLSYTVGRAVPTIATSSRPSSSSGQWSLEALSDQIEPSNAGQTDIPFFRWDDHRGTREWVQYDFDGPKQISSSEVYWAEGTEGDQKWSVPVSWILQYRDGEEWKNVQTTDAYSVVPGRFNRVTFEAVTTSALRLEAELPKDATSGIYEWRVNTSAGKQVTAVQEIEPVGTFQLNGDALEWTFEVRNQTGKPIEVGDLAIPLPFNTQYVWDKTTTYTKRLIKHSFIGGNGSYIFWMRSNAAGPYLVMVPEKGTQLEYFDQHRGETFRAYIHSAASGDELTAKGGKWRLPHTKTTLAPKGQPGDSAHYAFKFRWAKDYDAVHEILYQEGGFDVNVVPGMTVPTDLPTRFSLRTRNSIRKIEAEYPDQTTVRAEKGKGKDLHIYSVKFSKLGENMLKVQYGDGQYLALDFFVTEPLETLIKKRAAFLVTTNSGTIPSAGTTRCTRSGTEAPDPAQSRTISTDCSLTRWRATTRRWARPRIWPRRIFSFPSRRKWIPSRATSAPTFGAACSRPRKNRIRTASTAFRTGRRIAKASTPTAAASSTCGASTTIPTSCCSTTTCT